MHIDLDRTEPQTFTSSVCIVGGGIAGLILATRLAAGGVDVHVLEAGGLEQEERSQAFYATEQTQATYRGSSEGRFRTFGGSSTRWGAQLLPFTHDIFEPGPGYPSRAWPIAESELAPYYPEIERIFEADALPFDAALLPALGHPAVPFPPAITLRFSKWAPFHRRSLAQTLGPEAIANAKITVFTHANVTGLHGAGQGALESIEFALAVDYAGREFRFGARHFVVAAGTVESSRLLLMSPSVANTHDQLGRFFNDHLGFTAGRFASPARERILDRLGPFFVDGTLHTCKLEASPALREQEKLHAVMAHVVVIEPEDSGTAAIRNLLRALQSGRLRQAISSNLLPVLRGAGDVVRLMFYAQFKRRRAVSKRAEVLLNVDVEQASDPDSRIRLSDKRDALGLPIAVVEWHVNQPERETAKRFALLIRKELEALGLAPTTWDESLDNDTLPTMADTFHAMGGLCMGTDPASSVVDPALNVHQLTNLHVASCAVFPSGSSSNPTFTLMALTMRLADRLLTLL